MTQATSGGNKSPEQPNTRQQQSAAGGGTAARSAPSSSSSARGRSSRNPKRFAVHSTHLSSADDPLGPLGESTAPTAPLGSPVLSPSARNLPASSQNPVAASSNASLKTLMGSINLEDEHQHQPAVSGRPPPPVQPAAGQDASRPHEPSVNVVQASKPSFHITVGDPHKVGDITSAHTEYMVYTKVSICAPPATLDFLIIHRLPLKHIKTPNLLFRADSATSCGYTTPCTTTIPASLSRHPRRSRPSAASTQNLSSPAVRL